ncbi:MAG: DNA repair protein RadC [Deltaproteobacteria bacterium]|nr:DNA repair protein RadC [Deltaproteobacteria bacterium]
MGTDALQDAELLALVLGTGVQGMDATRTAQLLLARFGSIQRLASAGIGELATLPGVGLVKACRLKAALALAGRVAERPILRGDVLSSPSQVFERVGRRLLLSERETMVALALDTKNRVLSEILLAQGGTCSVELRPKDAFSLVVREAAAGVIFVHNHPSGDPSPSDDDEKATARLRNAGDLVGVRVLDHTIVARGGYYSFAAELKKGKK